jgi:prepilin-type N-terminal cleavage/methylation domain-containing protein
MTTCPDNLPTTTVGARANGRFNSRRSFTLIELLVVIAIILLLAGLLFTGARTAIVRAQRGRARTEVCGIAAGIRTYVAERGCCPYYLWIEWPYVPNALTVDYLSNGTPVYTLGQLTNALLEIQGLPLRGAMLKLLGGPKYNSYWGNPGRTYLDLPLSIVGSNYTAVDPWKNQYLFLCDQNGDGRIPNPFNTTTVVRASVLVWSPGPDGRWTNDTVNGEKSPVNLDNIQSW